MQDNGSQRPVRQRFAQNALIRSTGSDPEPVSNVVQIQQSSRSWPPLPDVRLDAGRARNDNRQQRASLTNKRLRCGVHRSVTQLKTTIRALIAAHHAKAMPFVWPRSADEILASIARFTQRTLDFRTAPVIVRTTRSGH
jgi:putative transposase